MAHSTQRINLVYHAISEYKPLYQYSALRGGDTGDVAYIGKQSGTQYTLQSVHVHVFRMDGTVVGIAVLTTTAALDIHYCQILQPSVRGSSTEVVHNYSVTPFDIGPPKIIL